MIGKVMKGRGFTGLARYLESGHDAQSPDRVEWIEARNLPTSDPHTASLIMRATAAQSVRVEKPVYHIALSFDQDDGADRAIMIHVADRLLDDLGLRNHQALIVAHGDTRHAHVHIMVNRVHPETFRAWHPTHDYTRIERSLREQERELALRAVPGHHYRLTGHEPPDRSQALTTGQLRKWDRTGELPFDEIARAAVRQDVVSARTWEQLEARLAEKGLRIEPRERGLVVTDGQEIIKASSIAPEFSRRNLEQRFGAMHGERYESDNSTAEPDAARAARSSQRAASAAGRDAGAPAESPGSNGRGGEADVTRPGRDVQGDAPRHGHEQHRSEGETNRPSNAPPDRAAARARRNRAEPGVHDREAQAAGRSHHIDSDRRDPAGIDRGDAGRNGRGARNPQLAAVRRTVDALERRTELEQARDTTSERLDRERVRLMPIEARHAEAREASRRFDAVLARVYTDHAAARHTFEGRARQNGEAITAAEIARYPERFGELHGKQMGPVRSHERKEALHVASSLERLRADHLRAVPQLASTRTQYEGARAVVENLRQRVKHLDADLAREAGSATLRERLGQQLRALKPAQRNALHRSLPVSQRRLFTAALAAARAFANEQGHER